MRGGILIINGWNDKENFSRDLSYYLIGWRVATRDGLRLGTARGPNCSDFDHLREITRRYRISLMPVLNLFEAGIYIIYRYSYSNMNAAFSRSRDPMLWIASFVKELETERRLEVKSGKSTYPV